jgi:hypothetical protein
MNIIQFAGKHRLRISTDPADGTPVIRGRSGKSHVFEHGDGVLGVVIMPETGTPHRWTAARKGFTVAGITITQNGDCEGAAIFDPENPEHVRLACRYADVRSRRKASPAQIASLAAGRALARPRIPVETPVAEGFLASGNDDWEHGSAIGSS